MTRVYRASVAQARGDVDGTVEQARRAPSLAGPDDHFPRGAANGFIGLAAWAAGDLSTAVETFTAAVASLHAAGMVADELGIGAFQVLFLICFIGYSLGGLLFGISLYRAGVLSSAASALFAYGTVSTLALAALPESFDRPFAVPVGIALIGLGVSLWRDGHRHADTVGAPATMRVAQAATQ